MRLVFAGTPATALPALEAVAASSHEVVGVITRPDAPAGRGRRLTPSPVAMRAEELGLPVLKPGRPSEPDFQAALRDLTPDVCPVVAYGALLPTSALDIPRLGWVNLHFSELPRWRGAAPVQRAIMAGDATIGTTCFQIVRELDAGDVYRMSSIPMPEATAGEVLAMLAESGAAQLLETLDAIEAGEVAVPQPADGVTVAPKVLVEDARIDWTQPAVAVRNLVLGCSPDPGAWSEVGDDRLKVYRVRVAEDVDGAPGQVRVTKRAAFVACGEGAMELLEVQPAGRKRMNAIDWARNLSDGTVLR